MKLSTRSTYGMRALVELALTAGHGPVSASVIAKRQDLSVAYLEQLLHRLKRRGIIRSVRGPRGGYVLARAPRHITMADVVGVLDGQHGGWNGKSRNGRGQRVAVMVGMPRRGGKDGSSKDAHRHAQRIAQSVWRCVHERLSQSLGTITLEDLCEDVRSQSGDPLEHRYVFHI